MLVRIALVYLSLVIINIYALRCRMDDTLSENNLRKIVLSCMRRFGNSNGFNKNDYGNNNGREDPYQMTNRNQNQMRSEQNRQPNDLHRAQQNERRYGMFMNRNSNNNNTDFDDHNQDRRNHKDENCVVYCFFQELNMLNNDNYPDKHKVLYIFTKDIRDNELKEFYTDAIHECFNLLEMEQRTDKCLFSKSLLNCMAEYARANCEDWENHTLLFN